MGEYKVFKTINPTSEKANTPKEQNKAYQKSFIDYLRENGKVDSGFVSFQGIATNNLYTCPKGKEFYLILVTATLQNSAVINLPTCDLRINTNPFFTIGSGSAADGSGNQSLAFPIPLKLVAGDVLSCENNRANCWVRVTYLGYEIDSSIAQKN